MALANGLYPLSALQRLDNTVEYVAADLHPQTEALRVAFAARFGKALTITDAYRSLAEQETIFLQRYTTNFTASAKIDRRFYKGRVYWRKPGYASAATPGASNHGLAKAIDFGSNVSNLNSAEHAWMVDNAPKFGWVWPKTFQKAPYLEPWHFEGTFVPASQYTDQPVPAPTPQDQEDEEDMTTFIQTLYRYYFNREPSLQDIIFWAVAADTNRWGADGLNQTFLNMRAEAGTVVRFYQELLGRDPDPAGLANWSDGETVRQVIDGIKNSEEYKNKH